MLPPFQLEQAIERVVREEWGRILASIVSAVGDLQLAEDSLQDAVEAALSNWPRKGLPNSPAGWLISVARRKAIDRIRREKIFADKQVELAYLLELQRAEDTLGCTEVIEDDRLKLMFMCCHPALPEKTRIALTLRTIGGLKTEEIARAFLDTLAAMAQRLARAKKKIRETQIPFGLPDAAILPERFAGVLGTIYLIFNEGYAASSGVSLTRVDLSEEAIRLARIMVQLTPDEPEVHGLLALMLLHDARRLARTDAQGNMIALEHQDRTVWNAERAEEGRTMLKQVLGLGRVGPYQIQAAISALHLEAPSWQKTDWAQIAALYNLLYQIEPSPVVGVNRAMAVSHSKSIEEALRILESLEIAGDVAGYQSFLVARADLLMRIGNFKDAADSLRKAIAVTENEVERQFLVSKLNKLDEVQ